MSCIVQDDCFQMGFNQPYGTFNYSKMHLNHIGTASDCAFERCLRLSLASKKSDLDFNDSIHDDDLAYRLKQSADVVPSTKMMYRHLSERVLALEKMVADVSGESESEKVVSYIRTIPRFEVRNYPSSNSEDTNKLTNDYFKTLLDMSVQWKPNGTGNSYEAFDRSSGEKLRTASRSD